MNITAGVAIIAAIASFAVWFWKLARSMARQEFQIETQGAEIKELKKAIREIDKDVSEIAKRPHRRRDLTPVQGIHYRTGAIEPPEDSGKVAIDLEGETLPGHITRRPPRR